MAAKQKKRPTMEQITKELKRSAADYNHLRIQLWEGMRDNAARRLGLEIEEIEEEFAALT